MSDPSRSTTVKASPPPAPPLPAFQPRRAGVLQRIAETVGLGGTSRPPSRAQPAYRLSGRELEHIHSYQPLPSQTTAHRTGIPIAALDINSDKTCAVLAGKEILKIVRFEEGTITEHVNLRFNLASANTVSEDIARKRKDYLPATDVKWSTGLFKNTIATAANHGRIAIYDVSRADIERAWVHEHTGPVHKLAFDPHVGRLLLSGSHDGSVKMWDLRVLTRASQNMRSVEGFLSKKAGIRDVKWCPTTATDALEFALCTDTGVIQKWDLRKPKQPLLSINAHGKSCLAIDWHPDGKHLLSGGLDKLVKVWDFHSEKGNQKAKFELNAPQGIRNIKWRPPCWSSELAGTGQWQCTQFATSYHQDDPRVHIWDLRRPHLAFRELERYKNAATDFLWASKDLIWTVGDEGWFTQTDVNFAPLGHHSVAPGAMDWFPDGQYIAFSENIGLRRGSGFEDPAVGFLSVPHEKLSSGEEMAVNNSFSDDDGALEGLLPNAFKRRQSRAASTKSGKSQDNTPPAPNGFPVVLSLEKAVPQDIFDNKQIGMLGTVTGLTTDSEVGSFLAESYARPSSEAERKADPGSILDKLETAFNLNADVCDEASMHRTAQSWRVLSSVIVPELKDWAEKNRTMRLEQVAKQKVAQTLREDQESMRGTTLAESSARASVERKAHDEREEKWQGNLFRAIVGGERSHALHDLDSTSNVTTPMARPLPDSPISDIHSPGNLYQNLDETLERLPQLPPSLLASHNTAAAASRALRDNAGSLLSRQLSPSTATGSDNSPSRSSHRRAASSQSLRSLQNLSPSSDRPSLQSQTLLSSPVALRPAARAPPTQTNEDRRAALRDYQKQARPLLTFDDPSSSPIASTRIPKFASTEGLSQASSEQQSFPLFPASDSSYNPADNGRPRRASSERERGNDLGANRSNRASHQGCEPQRQRPKPQHQGSGARAGNNDGPLQPQTSPSLAGVDVASDGFSFGMDGLVESREKVSTNGSDDGAKAWEDWDDEDYARYTQEQERHTTRSSTSSSPHEPFRFDHEGPVKQRVVSRMRDYQVNPFIREGMGTTEGPELGHPSGSTIENMEELASVDFILHDFRPIDLTTYRPPTPFAWSALPLITQSIAFDLDTGPAYGQFSAHLLAHVHPFFFHQRYRSRPTSEILAEGADYGVADRLMHPSLNSRVFEQIFTEHDRYLRKMDMFVQMAEFRKFCAEFEYPGVYSEDTEAIEAGLTSATPHLLSITCANCRAPMQDGDVTCQRCKSVRSVCPICSSLTYDPGTRQEAGEPVARGNEAYQYDRGLWALCQGCGHSAHLGCLEDWLAHPFSEGECPTSNCGHDCGPGRARVVRVEAMVEEEDSDKTIRTANPAAVKDRWNVASSAAVERTRKSLRGLNDRGTQSGDESGRIRSSFGSRSGGGLPSQGQRKSVRLVTPNEERERSLAME